MSGNQATAPSILWLALISPSRWRYRWTGVTIYFPCYPGLGAAVLYDGAPHGQWSACMTAYTYWQPAGVERSRRVEVCFALHFRSIFCLECRFLRHGRDCALLALYCVAAQTRLYAETFRTPRQPHHIHEATQLVQRKEINSSN